MSDKTIGKGERRELPSGQEVIRYGSDEEVGDVCLEGKFGSVGITQEDIQALAEMTEDL